MGCVYATLLIPLEFPVSTIKQTFVITISIRVRQCKNDSYIYYSINTLYSLYTSIIFSFHLQFTRADSYYKNYPGQHKQKAEC